MYRRQEGAVSGICRGPIVTTALHMTDASHEALNKFGVMRREQLTEHYSRSIEKWGVMFYVYWKCVRLYFISSYYSDQAFCI